METDLKRKLIAAAVIVVALTSAGVAVAATQLGSPREESQAIIDDAAKELGVEPSALSNALKNALKNRVDAAVADGRITKEDGDAIKERIDSGGVPLFRGPHRGFGPGPFGRRHHFGLFHAVEAAASYLDLTLAELRSQLNDGKTLAEIARDRDKSVDGLVDALVNAQRQKLDRAVEAGRLTDEKRDAIAEDLPERMRALVNAELRFKFRLGFGDRERFRSGLFRGATLFGAPQA